MDGIMGHTGRAGGLNPTSVLRLTSVCPPLWVPRTAHAAVLIGISKLAYPVMDWYPYLGPMLPEKDPGLNATPLRTSRRWMCDVLSSCTKPLQWGTSMSSTTDTCF